MRRESKRTQRRRRGVSLIELLIVLTVLAVILSTSTVTLYRLLRAQTAGTTELAEAMSVSRLARDLRRDAHAATAATLTYGAHAVDLELSSESGDEIVYRVWRDRIARQRRTADGTSANEEYRLGDVTTELELTAGDRLITLTLRPTVKTQAEASDLDLPVAHRDRVVTRIQAAVLHEFSKPTAVN